MNTRNFLILLLLIGAAFAFSEVIPEENLKNNEINAISLVDVNTVTKPPITVQS